MILIAAASAFLNVIYVKRADIHLFFPCHSSSTRIPLNFSLSSWLLTSGHGRELFTHEIAPQRECWLIKNIKFVELSRYNLGEVTFVLYELNFWFLFKVNMKRGIIFLIVWDSIWMWIPVLIEFDNLLLRNDFTFTSYMKALIESWNIMNVSLFRK